MNIAHSASEAAALKVTTTTIYVNMEFDKLATDINSGTLEHQFNGTGRKIAYLPEKLESNYLSYSSDSAGKEIIEPPFEINNGDNIEFRLQASPTGNSCATFKWKGIIQNNYDLKLVLGKTSIYNADIQDSATTSEDDEVNIKVKFKLNGDKFYVVWDPRIKIGKV